MPSPMAIFSSMSDSKWPSGGHLDCAILRFWAITPKLMKGHCFVHVRFRGFWSMLSPMAIFSSMSDSKWPSGSHLDCAILTFWAITPKLMKGHCFVNVRYRGFWSMPSPMAIFSSMSDSKWPSGGHLDCTILTFWAITPKLMAIQLVCSWLV